MLFGSSQKYLKMNKWVTTGNIIDYHVWGDRESIGDKGRLWSKLPTLSIVTQ